MLADYTSEAIDLSNPGVYRDLSKPIGALNPTRLKDFIERYNGYAFYGHFEALIRSLYQFCGPDHTQVPLRLSLLQRRHCPSLPCQDGALHLVLFAAARYGVRATLEVTNFAADGKFDHAERMFFSIPQTWHSCLNSTSDVKVTHLQSGSTDLPARLLQELIPEFFYQPEFLCNSNNWNLGTKQDGTVLGDVILPPWAKTPHDFIRINHDVPRRLVYCNCSGGNTPLAGPRIRVRI